MNNNVMHQFNNINDYIAYKENVKNSYDFMMGEINKGYKQTLIFFVVVVGLVALYMAVKQYKEYKRKKIKLARKKAILRKKYNLNI